MPMEFEIRLTAQDLYRFHIYHNYTGFNGWFSILIAVMALIASYITVGLVPLGCTILYAVFGILFLLYLPVTFYIVAKRKISKAKEFSTPLLYRVTKDGITVRQGEESSTLPWGHVYKAVATRSNVLIYHDRVHAYVIPMDQLGTQYAQLREFCKKYLERSRVRMQNRK